MADAAAAAQQAANAAEMQDAAQHPHPRPPEQTNNAPSNSLESHLSVQVLHQRLAQPQAQQPLPPTQQHGTAPCTAGGSMPSSQHLCMFLSCCVPCNDISMHNKLFRVSM